MPFYDGRVNVDIVDAKGNPTYVTPQSLSGVFSKGVEANIAVSASIYVMAGGGFGVTWRVSHAQVFQQSRVTAASIFSDSIQDGEDEEESTPVPAPSPAAVAEIPFEVPDLDDEDAPAPPPVPQRKRRAAPAGTPAV